RPNGACAEAAVSAAGIRDVGLHPHDQEEPMNGLEGKVALVTGASRGIGAAIARTLDREGVRLALASRSGADLGIAGAFARPVDVRHPAALAAFADDAAATLGGIDILVVNAGVGA